MPIQDVHKVPVCFYKMRVNESMLITLELLEVRQREWYCCNNRKESKCGLKRDISEPRYKGWALQ